MRSPLGVLDDIVLAGYQKMTDIAHKRGLSNYDLAKASGTVGAVGGVAMGSGAIALGYLSDSVGKMVLGAGLTGAALAYQRWKMRKCNEAEEDAIDFEKRFGRTYGQRKDKVTSVLTLMFAGGLAYSLAPAFGYEPWQGEPRPDGITSPEAFEKYVQVAEFTFAAFMVAANGDWGMINFRRTEDQVPRPKSRLKKAFDYVMRPFGGDLKPKATLAENVGGVDD